MTGFPDDFIAGVAGNPRRARTPRDNMALGIHGKDAIAHGVNHGAEDVRIFPKIKLEVFLRIGQR